MGIEKRLQKERYQTNLVKLRIEKSLKNKIFEANNFLFIKNNQYTNIRTYNRLIM